MNIKEARKLAAIQTPRGTEYDGHKVDILMGASPIPLRKYKLPPKQKKKDEDTFLRMALHWEKAAVRMLLRRVAVLSEENANLKRELKEGK